MSTNGNDGYEVLVLVFVSMDEEANGDQNLQHYEDRHNLERRMISKLFDHHGRKLVQNYYAYVYSEQFPLNEYARIMAKIAEEGPKEPNKRVWNYEDLEARLAQLDDYTNQYTAASERYKWAECRRILVVAQAKA